MQSVPMQSSKLHICGHLLFVYDNVSSLQPSTVAYFPFCQLLAHHLFTGLQLLCQQILTYFLQLRVLSCSVWGFWVFFFLLQFILFQCLEFISFALLLWKQITAPTTTDWLCLTSKDCLFNILNSRDDLNVLNFPPSVPRDRHRWETWIKCQEESSWQCLGSLSESGNQREEPKFSPSSYLVKLLALNCYFSSSSNLLVHCRNKQFWLLYSKGLHQNMP